MKIIGLTGGIGSGKSSFCKLMFVHGIETIDTDQIAREVVKPDTEGLKRVVKEFGKKVLNEDGSLNRTVLRNIIFRDPQDSTGRLKLESILHPLIQDKTLTQIQQFKQDKNYRAPFLLVAIPLLIEGIVKKREIPDYLDEIWVIDCLESKQIERASQRDGTTIEQIKNIIASQATPLQRLSFANLVIDNNQDLEHLEQQVAQIINTN